MNQALILLIFLSLFSFLSASIQCQTYLKVACSSSSSVGSCRCVSKNTTGNFTLTHTCTSPQRPTCFQKGRSIACICQ